MGKVCFTPYVFFSSIDFVLIYIQTGSRVKVNSVKEIWLLLYISFEYPMTATIILFNVICGCRCHLRPSDDGILKLPNAIQPVVRQLIKHANLTLYFSVMRSINKYIYNISTSCWKCIYMLPYHISVSVNLIYMFFQHFKLYVLAFEITSTLSVEWQNKFICSKYGFPNMIHRASSKDQLCHCIWAHWIGIRSPTKVAWGLDISFM